MSLKATYTFIDSAPKDFEFEFSTEQYSAQAREYSLARAREMLNVKTRAIADIRDGQILNKPQFQFQMLAVMLRQALINEGKLSVLDFGGMLGTSYFQFLRFAENNLNLLWSIVELPPKVEEG